MHAPESGVQWNAEDVREHSVGVAWQDEIGVAVWPYNVWIGDSTFMMVSNRHLGLRRMTRLLWEGPHAREVG